MARKAKSSIKTKDMTAEDVAQEISSTLLRLMKGPETKTVGALSEEEMALAKELHDEIDLAESALEALKKERDAKISAKHKKLWDTIYKAHSFSRKKRYHLNFQNKSIEEYTGK